MNLNQFMFTKKRRLFGRQPLFSDINVVLFDEPSHHEIFQKNFILRNPVGFGTQLSKNFGFSEAETDNAVLAHRGLCHYEGGWPKDVNYLDEEQNLRHRKKAERDDNFGPQLMKCTKYVMASVLQNSASNIYQDYFTEIPPVDLHPRFEAVNLNIYHDMIASAPRPITQIGWSPGESSRFLSVHSSFERYPASNVLSDFFIWDVNNPLKPVTTFTSGTLTTRARYCPKDENLVAGGLHSGMCAIWDSRISGPPVNVCPLEAAHRDVVSSFCWVHSKSNTEFYTGSTDCSICFWDGRNLRRPFTKLYLDTTRTNDQNPDRAHGCSVLEFEYTIPIRFMAGSELGALFLGNRKGFTPVETLIGHFKVTNGPVKAIERNPSFVKNFLVIGEWCAKIWSEDCKDYPITRFTNQKSKLNCAAWSPTRCSLFMTGNEAGELDFWDLLLDHKKPIFTMAQFLSPITSISAKEDGKLVAVATQSGDVYLVQLDEVLTRSGPKDKAIMAAMMERELHRCKLQEGRTREIRLNAYKNNIILSLDSQLQLQPDEITDEEISYVNMEGALEMSEEEIEYDADAAEAPGATKPVEEVEDRESEIEEIEEEDLEEKDPEFTEARDKFLMMISEEKQKYKDRVYVMEKCAFEPGYIPSDEEEEEDVEQNV